MSRYAVLFAALVPLVPSSAVAEALLSESGEFGPEPSSEIRQFAVEVQETGKALLLETTVKVTQGKVTVRVIDPEGKRLAAHATTGSMRIGGQRVSTSGRMGIYHVEVVPDGAVGTWTVHVSTVAESWEFAIVIVPGIGMVIVGLGAALLWRRWSGARWRWFWVGAAVWTVGVFLKFACAIPLNKPLLGAIEARTSHAVYLALGSFYIGLLTGVFEVGITLLAALVWKRMARDASRGVAVGVGAGAFEAVLLGAVTMISVAVALAMGGDIRQQVAAGVASATKVPLFWLVGPVERVTAILCHTASRALVLLGVARGRWFWPFVGGFLIMTAIDAVAGYVHLAGLLGKVSTWWIELALAPAALLSIPIIVWCARNWPDCREDATAAATNHET